MILELSTLLQMGQFVAYVVGITVFIVMIKADVRVLKVELKGISENVKVLNGSFDRLGSIMTSVAVQDTRLTGIEEDIKELRHGKGFISGALNGEYDKGGKC